jgi:acyl-CoA thioesterase FadM
MFSSILPYLPLSNDFARYFNMAYYGWKAREYIGTNAKKQHHWNIPITVEHQVSISDLDELGHMNNLRYLRCAEFLRIYFMMTSRIWEALKKRNKEIDEYNRKLKQQRKHAENNTMSNDNSKQRQPIPIQYKKHCGFVLGNAHVRFRKELLFKEVFYVTCKIIAWDEKNVYFEHLIINQQNIVCCYILCQQATANVKATELMSDVTRDTSPPLPAHVTGWLNSIETQKQYIPRTTAEVHKYVGDASQLASTASDSTSPNIYVQRQSKL